MNEDFNNKISIVTGAAQGIGETVARGLAQQGSVVVLVDLNGDKLTPLLNELKSNGHKALAVTMDVSKLADLDKLVEQVIETYGHIDILVNCAGICPLTDLAEITEDEWDQVLSVNLKAVFFLCQKVIPHMQKAGQGRIINIASIAGKVGGINTGAHYAASKAAIEGLTKTFARHGASHGILVNAICPGAIGTNMVMCMPEEKLQNYRNTIPLGTIGTAEDVADAILFLASDRAKYITGEVLDVNGGLLMD